MNYGWLARLTTVLSWCIAVVTLLVLGVLAFSPAVDVWNAAAGAVTVAAILIGYYDESTLGPINDWFQREPIYTAIYVLWGWVVVSFAAVLFALYGHLKPDSIIPFILGLGAAVFIPHFTYRLLRKAFLWVLRGDRQ